MNLLRQLPYLFAHSLRPRRSWAFLTLFLVLGSMLPTSRVHADPADPAYDVSCVAKMEEVGQSGPPYLFLFDGLQTVTLRCFMNDSAGADNLRDSISTDTYIVDGVPAAEWMRILQNRQGSSVETVLTCGAGSTITATQHGELLYSDGSTIDGTAGLPTNFVEFDIDCVSFSDWRYYENPAFLFGPLGTPYLMGAHVQMTNPSPRPSWEPRAELLYPTGVFEQLVPRDFGYTFSDGGPCYDVDARAVVNGGPLLNVLEIADTVALPGDSVVFLAIYDPTSGLGPADFGARLNPADPFQTYTDHVVDVDGVAYTSFGFRPTATTPLNLAEMSCEDDEGVAFYGYETGEGWETTPDVPSICRSLVILRSDETYEAGDSVSVAYSLGAGPFTGDEEGISQLSFRQFGDPVDIVGSDVVTTNTIGAQIGGSAAPWLYVVPEDSRGVMTFTAAAPFSQVGLDVRCTDETGTVTVGGGTRPIFDGGTVGGGSSDASCYGGAGMSLNPATWVGGFVRAGVCFARDIALPSDGFITGWIADQKDKLGDVAPFSIILQAVEFGDELASEMENPTNGPECFGMDVVVESVDVGADVCPGLASGVALGQQDRDLIAVLFIAPSVVGLFFHLRGLLRDA